MSILDDAIREHLELKRAHGADTAELKKLEDEAFGPPARPDEPDPLAEAPTEFMTAPGSDAESETGGRRAPNIADLQEAPPAPADEEQPAMEHEVVPAAEDPEPADPAAERGHSTEERQAIAEQPTEMFDVEGTYEDAATEGPSDDDLVDAELVEPRLAPVDPLAGLEDQAVAAEPDVAAEPPAAAEPEPAEEEEPEDEFDEFFSEQRLSDELNQALEAPLPDEPGAPATDEAPAAAEIAESDEHAVEDDAEFEEAEEYAEDEDDLATDEEGEHTEEHEAPDSGRTEQQAEDVLEDTPDFLENAPEDDDLWFEQRPPKDFDFDD